MAYHWQEIGVFQNNVYLSPFPLSTHSFNPAHLPTLCWFQLDFQFQNSSSLSTIIIFTVLLVQTPPSDTSPVSQIHISLPFFLESTRTSLTPKELTFLGLKFCCHSITTLMLAQLHFSVPVNHVIETAQYRGCGTGTPK